MTIVYLVSFVGGLLMAVRVMMYGVERRREDAMDRPSFRLSPAVIVSFCVVFGAVGYLLTRHSVGRPLDRLALAAVAGGLCAGATAYVVRRWWEVVPEHDVDDERYVLQGQVARVTKAVRADVDGEVAFQLGAVPRTMAARSFDAGAFPAGTEVVIERVEDGVAYIEAWADVEKRL